MVASHIKQKKISAVAKKIGEVKAMMERKV